METIIPPKERVCERCGRTDIWNGDQETWVAASVDGQTQRGTPHCLHEWDINGCYSPLVGE